MKRTKLATFLVASGVVLGTSALVAYAASGDGKSDDGMMSHAVKHAKVRLALLENVGADALRIDIDVKGSTAHLKGTVNKRETVELAERYAGSVTGIDKVTTDLEIAQSSDEGLLGEASAELSDAILESKVKMALLSALGTGAFRIEVESADGVVALSGKVDGDRTRSTAAATTKDVSGVKEVRNLLEVASS